MTDYRKFLGEWSCLRPVVIERALARGGLDRAERALWEETNDGRNAWREVRDAAGEYAGYADDVKRVRAVLRVLEPGALGRDFGYALLLASIPRPSWSPAFLRALVEQKLWTKDAATEAAHESKRRIDCAERLLAIAEVSDEVDRAPLVIEVLASIMAAEDEAVVADIIGRVAALLPCERRGDALKAVRSMRTHLRRAESLVALLPHLPSGTRREVAEDACAQIAQIPNESTTERLIWSEALLTEAAFSTQSDAIVQRRALLYGRVAGALARDELGPSMRGKALGEATGIRDHRVRLVTLARIAGLLAQSGAADQAHVERIVDEVLTHSVSYAEIEPLAALIRGPRRRALVNKSRRLDPRQRGRALALLARTAPNDDKGGFLPWSRPVAPEVIAAEAFRDGIGARDGIDEAMLGNLVPFLDRASQEKAVARVAAMEDSQKRCLALSALLDVDAAPPLAERIRTLLRGTVLEHSRSERDPILPLMSRVLTAEDGRHALATRDLGEARDVDANHVRFDALSPEESASLLRAMLVAKSKCADAAEAARFLGRLLPGLEGDARSAAFELALDLAKRVPSRDGKLLVRSWLAPMLAEERPLLFAEIIARVKDADGWIASELALNVLPYLDGEARDTVAHDAIATLSDPEDVARLDAHESETWLRLVAHLPPRERVPRHKKLIYVLRRCEDVQEFAAKVALSLSFLDPVEHERLIDDPRLRDGFNAIHGITFAESVLAVLSHLQPLVRAPEVERVTQLGKDHRCPICRDNFLGVAAVFSDELPFEEALVAAMRIVPAEVRHRAYRTLATERLFKVTAENAPHVLRTFLSAREGSPRSTFLGDMSELVPLLRVVGGGALAGECASMVAKVVRWWP